MMLKEIVEKCGALEIYRKRSITEEYCELVFYSKDTAKWNAILTGIFGQAIKAAGKKPVGDDMQLTKGYGGIYHNQTLFKKEFDGTTIIAMFWPWQDGVLTTLKLAVLEK
ncbi:MAG: hypothetical protein HQ547_00870 [Candidatus Omnitrophica bacterium]|nr:hypothetical protein [Candidatus Omnitrophota bacterium]